MWRCGRGRQAVSSEERAGGISARRREVKMSAKIATCREVLVHRMEARAAQAGAPRVLPLRLRVVVEDEDERAERCGRMESAVSSLGWGGRRVNVSSEAIM